MQRKILIVDDKEINRRLLQRTLGGDYDVLEAADGEEALAILRRDYKSISAVLLDIVMPVMDGYVLLERMREDEALIQIPVIVTTGNAEDGAETRALSLGANDFITKPYNPVIIKHRLWNTIKLRENAAAINALQRDELTGLYNRRTFFEKAEEMIAARPEGYYVMTGFDINNFKVINDQYGGEKGDSVLKQIADACRDGFDAVGGLCGRITADRFAALYPLGFIDSEELTRTRRAIEQLDGAGIPIALSIGRYLVDDKSLPVSAMYERAAMAEESVKGRYDVHIAEFDASMRERILREQEITGEMNAALENGDFEVWLQPQYNHSTGALIGAEALARWRHPKKGIIMPGDFIPVFERNGFVYELDKYVWKQSCRLLRQWIDEGRTLLPVSVNISRYDVFADGIIETLTGLVEQYRIPADMLRLEITESAFAESTEQIIRVVRRLIDYGFTVEIDDFGSGYSSLNTLKDVPAQVLKLDMRFLENDRNSQRGGNILESVVRMAKWLGMSVIAEGVEVREQADYLRSIGCNYVQGYLYGRPMPLSEYEALAGSVDGEERMLALETVENLDNNAFWDPRSMDSLIFNSYVGCACIFEYRNGRIELLRATEQYAQLFGDGSMTVAEALELPWSEHLDAEGTRVLDEALARSAATGNEVTGEYVFLRLPGCPEKTYLRSMLRVIAVAGDSRLVYCLTENITAQREAEQRIRALNENLINLMNDTPGGFARFQVQTGGPITMLYANERLCEMLGAPAGEILRRYRDDATWNVHPDDVPIVRAAVARVLETGETDSVQYRLRHEDGHYLPLRVFGRLTVNERGERFLNVYFAEQPVVRAPEGSADPLMPIAFAAMLEASPDIIFIKDADLRYVCCSRMFVERTGLTSERDVIGKTDYDFVEKSLADRYTAIDREILASGRPKLNYVEGEPLPNGGMRYANISKYLLYDTSGSVIGLYGVGRDVTAEREAYAQMKLLTDSIPGGLATYVYSADGIRVAYCNDGFCELLGCAREEIERRSEAYATGTVFSEDLPALMAQFDALARDNTPMDCVYRIHCGADGGYKWISLKGVCFERYEDTVFINAVLFDVTTRMTIEEQLRISEEELRVALSRMGKMVFLYDIPARRLTVPDAYAKKHGLPAVLEGASDAAAWRSVVKEEDVAGFRAFFEAIRRGEQNCVAEARVADTDGVWRWERAESVTVFDSDGRPVKAVVSVEDVTDQRSTEAINESIRKREEMLRMVVAHSARIIYRYDIKTREAVCVDPAASEAMGVPDYVEEMPESLIREGVIVPEDADFVRELFATARTRNTDDSMRCRARVKSGAIRWLDVKYSYIREGDTPTEAIISFSDVTDLHEREVAYARYRQSVDTGGMGDALYFETDVTADLVEKQGGDLLPGELEAAGRAYTWMIERITERYFPDNSRESARNMLSREHLLTLYADGQRALTEDWEVRFSDGSLHWVRAQLQMIEDPYTGHVKVFSLVKDISSEKQTDLEIQKRAALDGMTGLLNRATAEAAIRDILAGDSGEKCLLMLLDIDDLKGINDRFGHAQGDRAIKAIATILKSRFRKTDVVGRAGGDEYIVFLHGVKNEEQLKDAIEAMCKRVGGEQVGKSDTRRLQCSVGCAIGYIGADTFETLFERADTALYHVKRSGKNSYAFYTPAMRLPD